MKLTTGRYRQQLYPRAGHTTHSGVDPAGHVFILAEGVGDLFISDHASRLACEVCARELMGLGDDVSENELERQDRVIKQALEKAIAQAERAMMDCADFNPNVRGSASACSLIYLSEQTAHIGHVGDTRVYLAHQGRGFRQLTMDHLVTGSALATRKTSLLRAIGFSGSAVCDTLQVDLIVGDWLLIVSSAVAAALPDATALDALLDGLEPEAAARALCDKGLAGGGEEASALCIRVDALRSNPHRIGSARRLALLRAISLFEGLSEQELLQVLPLIRERRIRSGAVLIEEGSIESAFYVLVEGRCMVSRGEPRVEIAEIGPGQVIGELSLGDQQPRSADVVALEACRLLVMEGREFEHFTRVSPMGPKLLWRLVYVLAQRMRETTRNASRDSHPREEP